MLSHQEILDTLAAKKLTIVDINQYKNLNSEIEVVCENGHHIITNLKTVRNTNFVCPTCSGLQSKINNVHNIVVPPKEGIRIVGIDNASNNAGLSIYDSGKLVFYHLYTFTGDTIERIAANRSFIENIVIKQWQADYVLLEDIQYQQNINTYKVLAMLLGNAVVVLHDNKIKYDTVLSKVWRSHFLINGKTRIEQKKQAIELVEKMYNISVTDDIAEAILLGKYAVDILNKPQVKKLF